MTLEEAITVLRSPEGKEETRRIYVLRRTVDFAEINMRACGVSREEAEQLIALAEELFPGSAETFGIVYGRRLKRVIDEVFGPAD